MSTPVEQLGDPAAPPDTPETPARRFRLPSFRRAKPPAEAPPPRRPVALIPPLIMPAHPLMWALAWTLRRAGWEPRIFVYPSWRRDIPANAARLAAWMQRWGVEELDVVTFSLGGIVLRWAAAHHDLPRLRRVVLLGPPNRGATMADWLDTRLGILFPAIWGRAARQLRRGDLGLCERAGAFPPGTEFAVIAGGRGSGKGLNPLIPGDNDFIVGVAETILPGMGDFTLVPHRHSLLPLSRRACRLTVRFLKDGRFRESPKKH